jgi:hypothetical protein
MKEEEMKIKNLSSSSNQLLEILINYFISIYSAMQMSHVNAINVKEATENRLKLKIK